MVVRGRELTKELLNNLNDISSTCLRGENGLFPRSWVILGSFLLLFESQISKKDFVSGWQRERRDESKVAGCRKWSRKI